MSDRLAVMHGGRVVGIVDPRTTDRYAVGRMMVGADEHGSPADELTFSAAGAGAP
jgi:ABC-type sugar transport system ATPase subunit